jgi:hypothetical protein
MVKWRLVTSSNDALRFGGMEGRDGGLEEPPDPRGTGEEEGIWI